MASDLNPTPLADQFAGTPVPWGILALIGGGLLLGFFLGKSGRDDFDEDDEEDEDFEDEDPTEEEEPGGVS